MCVEIFSQYMCTSLTCSLTTFYKYICIYIYSMCNFISHDKSFVLTIRLWTVEQTKLQSKKLIMLVVPFQSNNLNLHTIKPVLAIFLKLYMIACSYWSHRERTCSSNHRPPNIITSCVHRWSLQQNSSSRNLLLSNQSSPFFNTNTVFPSSNTQWHCTTHCYCLHCKIIPMERSHPHIWRHWLWKRYHPLPHRRLWTNLCSNFTPQSYCLISNWLSN